ncbi:hypothetical protein C9382_05935 [Pseudomonas aylmerensis]|uniref:Uncharacterized protein n=1 Tax=Pseudomonas aylmerensis TaxID=1869229 RepID=A0A2T4G7E0_9PSED|nr:hypothetical protein C9382_05935 [Pseudomonas aylmerensis]
MVVVSSPTSEQVFFCGEQACFCGEQVCFFVVSRPVFCGEQACFCGERACPALGCAAAPIRPLRSFR